MSKSDTTGAWSVERGRAVSEVVVRFTGLVDEEAGRASARAVIELLGEEASDLIFDVVDVGAYRAGARKAWQSALWPRRAQIRSLTVISGSSLTRMGAKLFASFLRIPCEVLPASARRAFRDAGDG